MGGHGQGYCRLRHVTMVFVTHASSSRSRFFAQIGDRAGAGRVAPSAAALYKLARAHVLPRAKSSITRRACSLGGGESHVPLQSEAEVQGGGDAKALRHRPGSILNPVGSTWIGLGVDYGIHGTPDPQASARPNRTAASTSLTGTRRSWQRWSTGGPRSNSSTECSRLIVRHLGDAGGRERPDALFVGNARECPFTRTEASVWQWAVWGGPPWYFCPAPHWYTKCNTFSPPRACRPILATRFSPGFTPLLDKMRTLGKPKMSMSTHQDSTKI